MKTAKQELSEMIAELEEKHEAVKKMLDETTSKINELKQGARSLTPDRIRVPENIKFEEINGTFALVSPNGKCKLQAAGWHGGIPYVTAAGESDEMTEYFTTIPLYLEPCKREDLKCGDVALSWNTNAWGIEEASRDFEQYCVILNDTECAYWDNDMSMAARALDRDHWYKVVK